MHDVSSECICKCLDCALSTVGNRDNGYIGRRESIPDTVEGCLPRA